MSANTPNLGLFQYDPSTDGAQTFNIQKALNENWDKVDAAMAKALANAESYDSTQTYALGDYCTVGGKLYKCTTAITEGEAWNPDHWTETSMSAELTELARQLSESHGVQMDLLWENASPTSAFAAQTIAIDLSLYSAVLIKVRYYDGNSFLQDYTPKFCFCLKGHTFIAHGYFGSCQFRIFDITDGGVVVSTGYTLSNGGPASVSSPPCYAPISIYGIKGISVTG